jgi:type VI protein secretion system component VasF
MPFIIERRRGGRRTVAMWIVLLVAILVVIVEFAGRHKILSASTLVRIESCVCRVVG